MRIDERKVTESASSNSLSICLPRWWARNHGLRGGSIVVGSLDGEGRLLVEPKKKEAAQNAQNTRKCGSHRVH